MKFSLKNKACGLIVALISASGLISHHAAAANISCREGMIVNGVNYKATSLTGIQVSDVVSTWTSTNTYNVTMSIMANQGLKNWYSSTDLSNWQPYGNRSDAKLHDRMSGCSSGLVVATQQVNTVQIAQGTGTVILYPGPTGGTKGQSFVLYDERRDGFISMSNIGVEAPYAYGYSKEDENIKRKISFTATFTNLKNVPDGVTTVNVMIPVGATSTWFPDGNGYNYWWATAGRSIPLSYAIVFPITVRSSNNEIIDPKTSCSTKSPVFLDHGVMSTASVSNNTSTALLDITCTGDTSASVEVFGHDDSRTDYSSVDLENGVTSRLSASANKSTWTRKLNSVPLKKGTTNVSVRSVLTPTGTVKEGSFSGIAIARVSYN